MSRIGNFVADSFRYPGADIINTDITKQNGRPPYYPITPETHPEWTLRVGVRDAAIKTSVFVCAVAFFAYALDSGLDARETQVQQPNMPHTTVSQTPIPENR